MDPTLKDQWLKALRSGEYHQHRDTLWGREDNHLCCIGVGVAATMDCKITGLDTERASKMLGLTQDQQDTLVDMNDGSDSKGIRRHSFAEIADYIEKHL